MEGKRLGTQIIRTHRLLLRPYRREDAHDMYTGWANDPEVTRFLTWPPHPDEKVTLAVLTDWIAHYPEDHYYHWAIEWEKTGHVIGDISVVHQNEYIREAEIGYCLSRAFWGQGIMPEALRAVIDFLFASEGFERIIARHDRNNPKSGRVMRKAGMLQEGIRRRAGLNNQGIVDEVCYAILKSDLQPKEEKPALPPVHVRLAQDGDLEKVNELRRQVNELHVSGEPAIFKPGFSGELRDYIYFCFHKQISMSFFPDSSVSTVNLVL
ncbi:MAG: GNAT family N-acetyltransferase [Clostridia bacterium]|nr:GNAT family N-acetyltransferase [Clostridia bacterium]